MVLRKRYVKPSAEIMIPCGNKINQCKLPSFCFSVTSCDTEAMTLVNLCDSHGAKQASGSCRFVFFMIDAIVSGRESATNKFENSRTMSSA